MIREIEPRKMFYFSDPGKIFLYYKSKCTILAPVNKLINSLYHIHGLVETPGPSIKNSKVLPRPLKTDKEPKQKQLNFL